MTRNHTTVYPPDVMESILSYNANVQIYQWVSLVGILLLMSLSHFTLSLMSWRRRRLAGEYTCCQQHPPKGCGRTGHQCTYWVPATVTALWRKYTVQDAPVLRLGSWAKVSLMLIYMGINLGLMLGGAHGDISWQAHHAARLSVGNLPLLIALTSKNNWISWLTGYSYESLNILHRWLARFIFVLVLVHVGGRIYVNDPNTSTSGVGHAYISWGILSFLSFFLMLVLATRIVRDRYYSLFIVTHVVLFGLFLGGLWVHRPQQAGWLIACIGVYAIDRIWRTGRIIYHHAYFRRVKANSNKPAAWVELLSGGDILRVSVRTRMKWIPGQHVYLHVPKVSPGGHPFTVSSISESMSPRPIAESNVPPAQTPLWRTLQTAPEHGPAHESRIELLVQTHRGLTRRLHDLASRADKKAASSDENKDSQSSRVNIDAWCEGPYGRVAHLGTNYETLLLLAGGSGISFILPVLLDLIRRAHCMLAGIPCEPVVIQRLSLCWVVRDAGSIEWVSDALHAAIRLAPAGMLNLDFHVTASAALETPTISSLRALAGSDTKFQINTGRPNLEMLLNREIEASDFSDWVCTAVCGPKALAANLKHVVAQAIRPKSVFRGELRRNIFLHEEQYGW